MNCIECNKKIPLVQQVLKCKCGLLHCQSHRFQHQNQCIKGEVKLDKVVKSKLPDKL